MQIHKVRALELAATFSETDVRKVICAGHVCMYTQGAVPATAVRFC
jgi:hypothetical protein